MRAASHWMARISRRQPSSRIASDASWFSARPKRFRFGRWLRCFGGSVGEDRSYLNRLWFRTAQSLIRSFLELNWTAWALSNVGFRLSRF